MSRLPIGYVARAHGVAGELRVHLHEATSQVLYEAARVFVAGVERQVKGARPTTGAVLLKIDGVADRESAEALKGAEIAVDREDVPLAEGEFLIADLVGCEVVDEAGTVLGRAVEILPGVQDVLVIHDEAARLERLLPVVPEFIRAVDVAARRVVVSPPDDLPAEPIRG